jgi:stage V sporulation protein G
MKGNTMKTKANTMRITEVQVHLNKDSNEKLKAYARICLDESLMLTGLRVYQGSNQLFVSYPNDPDHKGLDFKQVFYPVNRNLRNHIEDVILVAYHKELKKEP